MIPVFIGGCGRSGTTMLGAMLGTHSQMLATPEFHFKTDVPRIAGGKLSQDSIPEVLDRLKRDVLFRLWKLDLDDARFAPACFDGTYRQFIERFLAEYGRQNAKADFGYWIDHTPANVSHAKFLLESFPDAKMIHLVRDGRAVAASVLPLDWGPHTLDKAAEMWCRCIGLGLAAEAVFSDRRVLRVTYEELVRQPDDVLERICGFLGAEFEPPMVRGDGFRLPGANHRQHALVGSVPQADRIDQWKRQLSPRQIELYEFYNGNLLELAGYSTIYGTTARGPSSAEHYRMMLGELFLRYWRRFGYFRRHKQRWYANLLGRAWRTLHRVGGVLPAQRETRGGLPTR